jgi:DHA1 family bicyclomycin/chloramphenicol resistance-like MFS transporter
VNKLGAPLLLLLIAISAIGPMALNGVLPATGVVMVELSTQYETAQLVLTVFLFANLVSQLVMGPLADQHGRRPIMLINLLIFVIGSVICYFASSIEILLFGRFVQGIGVAACVFLPRTIVRDIYSAGKAASMIGYMTTAMMVAPLFGPALGGWITDTLNWRYMYSGFAILGCLLFVAAYKYQYETLASKLPLASVENRESRWSFFQSSIVLLKDRRFLACTLMQAGAVGVYYSFLSGAPYVAIESRGMSASSYGAWFSMVAVGYLSGNFTAGRLSERLGVQRMILLGLLPYVFGIGLFWILLPLDHPVALFLPILILAYSNGMSLPSMITLAMSFRPSLAASASGLAGSAQTAFGVALSLVAGLILPSGDYWLFVLITFSGVVALIGLLCCIRQEIIVLKNMH